MPSGEDVKCASGQDYSKEECVDAALSVGGKLCDGNYLVGDWPNAPPGCFIKSSDNAIHFRTTVDGINFGRFRSVCELS